MHEHLVRALEHGLQRVLELPPWLEVSRAPAPVVVVVSVPLDIAFVLVPLEGLVLRAAAVPSTEGCGNAVEDLGNLEDVRQ